MLIAAILSLGTTKPMEVEVIGFSTKTLAFEIPHPVGLSRSRGQGLLMTRSF